MKLRNKKTGEIIENACIVVFKHHSSGDCKRVDTEARSLEKVLEEWEDYKPKGPLIKDEKIRKAVKAWAEVESIPSEETVFYNDVEHSFGWYYSVIEFSEPIQDLREGEYTIAELCGEGEE